MAQLKRQQTELFFSALQRDEGRCVRSQMAEHLLTWIWTFFQSEHGFLYIQAESNFYLYSHKTLSPGKSEKELIWKQIISSL